MELPHGGLAAFVPAVPFIRNPPGSWALWGGGHVPSEETPLRGGQPWGRWTREPGVLPKPRSPGCPQPATSRPWGERELRSTIHM